MSASYPHGISATDAEADEDYIVETVERISGGLPVSSTDVAHAARFYFHPNECYTRTAAALERATQAGRLHSYAHGWTIL